MRVGLLWYDDSQVDFAIKVQGAAGRYEEKFGARPNRCYVNPASMPGEVKRLSLNGLKVLASTSVLPDQFWGGLVGFCSFSFPAGETAGVPRLPGSPLAVQRGQRTVQYLWGSLTSRMERQCWPK